MDISAPLGCTSVVNLHSVDHITIAITWKNPLGRTISGTWGCDWAKLVRTSCYPSVTYTLTPSIADSSISLPLFGTATVSLDVTGWADVVQKGEFSAALWCDCSPDDSGAWVADETFYLVDATPAGWQSTPWTDVLDLSCIWADGRSGKSACLHYCTTGLHWSDYFTYSGFDVYHIVQDAADSDLGKFELHDLFAGSASGYADCRDTSSFLSLCTSAVGYDFTLTQGFLPGSGVGTWYVFWTSDIHSIGGSGFAPTPWNFHQFCEEATGVYDACAAQAKNLSGATYNDVPYAWPRADYWQKSDGSGDFWGLVRGYSDGSWHVPALVYPLFPSAKVWGPFDTSDTNKNLLQGIK